MNTTDVRRRVWWGALAIGAVTGLVTLGIGGRFAMRLFALHTGARPGWTFGGTATVIFMGVVSGIAGAAIRAAAAAWIPKRFPTGIGSIVFVIACLLLTLRGLKPVDGARLAYFLPVTLAYIIAFELIWRSAFSKKA